MKNNQVNKAKTVRAARSRTVVLTKTKKAVSDNVRAIKKKIEESTHAAT